MRVGLIGLGAMGMPTMHNLLAAGHELVVYDLNPVAVATAVAAGASAAQSPADAAAKAAVILTFVPNDAVLRELTLGERGILATAPPGCVHVSCSTVHPDLCRELAALHAKKGGGFVGAPVFARADGMARREASFTIGGEERHVQVP